MRNWQLLIVYMARSSLLCMVSGGYQLHLLVLKAC